MFFLVLRQPPCYTLTVTLVPYPTLFRSRAFRPLSNKPAGIVIDHVGNVQRHRLPDAPRAWSLDARERSARATRDPDAIPVTTCTNCFRVFEATSDRKSVV